MNAKLLIVVVFAALVGGAFWFFAGDPEVRAIEDLIRSTAKAVEDRDADTVKSRVAENFGFEAAGRMISAHDVRSNTGQVLRDSKIRKVELRSINIIRNGDTARATLVATITTSEPVLKPYPQKIELELIAQPGDGGKKQWLFSGGRLADLRD